MPATPQVSGACEILVDTGASRALESFGWTANGADFREGRQTLPIPGDQNGGDNGVPIEIQDLGATISMRLEMTKWDNAVAAKIRRGNNPVATAFSSIPLGGVVTPGTFIVANGGYFRLLLKPVDTSWAHNFLCAIPEGEPYSLNLGAKHSRLIVSFTCYPLNGVIFNAVTT